MKHTISVQVENKFGVLARISGLFSARGYNIDSLAVGETEDPDISRITIVVHGDESVLEQVTKQLNKLPDVIKVKDFLKSNIVKRDLILIKVFADKKVRAEIVEIAAIFRAKIVDVAKESITIEVTGNEDKVVAFIDLVKPYKIKEIVRTGIIAIERGEK
ncbi:MAG: acetolactate synthase small subunit [Elusimicrobia bacterium]|jgi:acetolactate synthase-1/3 small subunit|nr:acetolactate synthase small subunit [Elusimicrobiota bacterium]